MGYDSRGMAALGKGRREKGRVVVGFPVTYIAYVALIVAQKQTGALTLRMYCRCGPDFEADL